MAQPQTLPRRSYRKKRFIESVITAGDRAAFSWKVREGLYRHIASQISNGVPMEKALESFRGRLKRRNKVSSNKIIGEIIKKMKDGSTLGSAMSSWLPNDETAIISSGELSGNLAKALELLVESTRRVDRVKGAFKSSMVTPLIYLIVMYVVLWVIGHEVTPGLKLVLPMEQASGLIYALYWTGDIAITLWALLPPFVLLIIGIVVAYSLPRWTGKWRVSAEAYFPYSMYRDIQGYTWLMSFTALMRAGMTDVKILQYQSTLANPWLKERVKTLWWRMDNGASLSDALLSKGKNGMPAFGFPNPDIVDDITSLADFPDFPEKIGKLATEWANDLEMASIARAKWAGFWAEIIMYIAMGTLMISINQMSTQLGSVAI